MMLFSVISTINWAPGISCCSPMFIKRLLVDYYHDWLFQKGSDCTQNGTITIGFCINFPTKCFPLFLHSFVILKSHHLFELLNNEYMSAIFKSFFSKLRLRQQHQSQIYWQYYHNNPLFD